MGHDEPQAFHVICPMLDASVEERFLSGRRRVANLAYTHHQVGAIRAAEAEGLFAG